MPVIDLLHRRRRDDGGSGWLDEPVATLTDWSERYGRAVAAGDNVALSTIGQEIFAWLDDVVEAFAPDAADDTLDIGRLPEATSAPSPRR